MIKAIRPRSASGFTAVELLITLFVAVAFIIAGYQLYGVIIKDGGATRAQSTANNLAYTYMRQYAASAPASCTTPLTPLTNSPLNTAGLSNATVTIVITCPYYPALTNIAEVQAIIKYNTPQQTITNAVYVTQ